MYSLSLVDPYRRRNALDTTVYPYSEEREMSLNIVLQNQKHFDLFKAYFTIFIQVRDVILKQISVTSVTVFLSVL